MYIQVHNEYRKLISELILIDFSIIRLIFLVIIYDYMNRLPILAWRHHIPSDQHVTVDYHYQLSTLKMTNFCLKNGLFEQWFWRYNLSKHLWRNKNLPLEWTSALVNCWNGDTKNVILKSMKSLKIKVPRHLL